MTFRSILILVFALAAACADRPTEDRPPPDDTAAGAPGDAAVDGVFDVRAVRFDDSLRIELNAMTPVEDGVWVTDVRQGTGPAAEPGTTVSIEYSGWLPDGILFERRPSPEGFGASEFVLGESAPVPVPGLNSAIAGMRTGGVRRVVLAPQHGYGLVGRPVGVPAGSPLVFEVRLLGVR